MTRHPHTDRPEPPRCQHPHCSRWITRDQSYCAQHRRDDDHSYNHSHSDTLAEHPPPAGSLAPPAASDAYRILLDNALRETLAKATSEILEKGLIDELGALRIVLLRVLVEEAETPALVASITRIVTVAAQAMRVQHAVSGEQATTVTETVGNLLKSLLPDPDPSSPSPEPEVSS